MLGLNSERKARAEEEAKANGGMTNSRHAALAAVERAKAQALDLERELQAANG